MHPLVLVDSHVHLWDPRRFSYPWLKDVPQLKKSFLPGAYGAASRDWDIRKLIFVECGCAADQNVAETTWICEVAKREPRLRGIIAHAPLELGEEALPQLEALAQFPLVKGVRRNLQGETDPGYMLRPEFLNGVRLLARFGFTFDLCVRSDQLRAAAELARRVPHVMFVLDHCGKPPVKNGMAKPWAVDLQTLGEMPNVACKISGLTTEADWEHWDLDGLRFYFDRAVRSFGFDRLMFGSDWPVATLATTYGQWVSAVSEYFSFATDCERLKLFQINAERIYRV